MATLIPGSDRAAVETQVLAITRDLLRELGNTGAIGLVSGSALLESDLGLGSIERVELFARIEKGFRVNLPENVISEAKCLDDVTTAVAASAAAIEPGSLEKGTVGSPGAIEQALEPSEGHPTRPDLSRLESADTAGHQTASGFQRFFEIVYGIYAAAVFLIWVVATWLIVLAMPKGRPAAGMSSAALWIYFKIVGCRIEIEGREHLEAYGPCIYVSNHTSYADVLVIMALFPANYHFIAKNEINDMPFIGTFLRKLGHFAFDRSKLRARSLQAEQMEKALLRGETLFVFAEGTFTAQPGVRQFQLGAFRASVKTGRPIVPVALRGAREFLRDGTFLPRPARITVVVSPALLPNPEPGREWTEVLRLRDEARRIIASHSGEPLLSSTNETPSADPSS